jgi:hypothetical protein
MNYKSQEQQFEFWCRPLWDWATNILENPQLAPLIEWDAKRLSKFNGESWVPFVDEPCTATRMWDVQVSH